MKRFKVRLAIAMIAVCGILVSGVADAKDRHKNKVSNYKVTITNITRGQIISPPIVISHNRHFELFRLGEPATTGLAALAEDAYTAELKNELDASGSVYDVKEASGGIMPGMSVTVEIQTKRRFQRISAAGMLVTTNDAFMAVKDVYAGHWGNTVNFARAYDAGSEFNSEMCDYVPGPPCGSHVHDDEGLPEGYVYIHSGIHGIGDLEPAEFDWLNPVATVTVQKVK